MLLPTKKSAQAPKSPKPCLLKTRQSLVFQPSPSLFFFVSLLGVVDNEQEKDVEKMVRGQNDEDGDGDNDAGKVVLDVHDDDYDCDVHGDDDDKEVVRGPH